MTEPTTPADVSPQAQAATTAAQAADVDAISLDEARKLRSESANLRKRLKELETAEEARTAATQSEQEKLSKQAVKLQAERDALITELQAERARIAISRSAAKVGIDPELAESLALSLLVFDDAGQPTNVEAVLKQLLAKWPHLATASSTAIGNGQTSRGQPIPIDPKNPPRLGDPSLWKR